MSNTTRWDNELVEKYDVNGPRYTSYPTANHFAEPFDGSNLAASLGAIPRNQELSLYLHVPFCDTICYYCACNKIVTNNRKHAIRYLEYLAKEVDLLIAIMGRGRPVAQLHLGGGTPTYLSDQQLTAVFRMLRHQFGLVASAKRDFSIELDPRTVDAHRIEHLVDLGINRISLGIQDFDPDVQRAVNRLQSPIDTANIINAARANGIKSVSVDLIYGLPLQTPESFERTLSRVIELSPDRISLYSYAHLPNRFKTQRQINVVELPTADIKLELLRRAIEKLGDADYTYVGMDHFAKRGDTLLTALGDGSLQRNFQGYTTHRDAPLIGLGVSAISHVYDVYSQNAKTLEGYYETLDQGRLAGERGYVLGEDDRVRAALIQQLMCRGTLQTTEFGRDHGLDFESYFAGELAALTEFEQDGLVERTTESLSVTPKGRFFIRNICMVFDAYLNGATTGFSKAI